MVHMRAFIIAFLINGAASDGVLETVRPLAKIVEEPVYSNKGVFDSGTLKDAAMLVDTDATEPASNGSLNTEKQLTAVSLGLVVLIAGLCLAAPSKTQAAATTQYKLPLFVVTWMILSAGLTMFNKWIFQRGGGNFPYVSIVTWCHMLSATVLTRVVQLIRPDLFPAVAKRTHSIPALLSVVAPVAFLQSLTFVLGNSAYLYLSVSYIQMIKAAMPAMVFVLSAFVGLENFSWTETCLLMFITLGVAGCSHGELQFSWVGFTFQMASFLCEGCRLIMLKMMLSKGTMSALDPLSALYYLAPLNMVALSLPMLRELQSIEMAQMLDLRLFLVTNCLMAFALNIAGVCLMSSANAVTFAVCGLLKDFALIIGSTFVFQNSLTREELVCSFVVVGAALAFQRYQNYKKEMAEKQDKEEERPIA